MEYYNSDYSQLYPLFSAMWGLWLILAIVALVSMWKIFEKAGVAGWKSIIPIYNMYCLFKITWGNGWIFLALLIPVLNAVLSIITTYRLSKVFHKGIGFCLGLLFLGIIFYPILAFDGSQYDPSVAQK